MHSKLTGSCYLRAVPQMHTAWKVRVTKGIKNCLCCSGSNTNTCTSTVFALTCGRDNCSGFIQLWWEVSGDPLPKLSLRASLWWYSWRWSAAFKVISAVQKERPAQAAATNLTLKTTSGSRGCHWAMQRLPSLRFGTEGCIQVSFSGCLC